MVLAKAPEVTDSKATAVTAIRFIMIYSSFKTATCSIWNLDRSFFAHLSRTIQICKPGITASAARMPKSQSVEVSYRFHYRAKTQEEFFAA
jgi:hypothetical protein